MPAEVHRRKGALKAKEFSAHLGLTHPYDLTLEELIEGQDAILADGILDGADGRTVFQAGMARVTIKKDLHPPAKRRFVLAHELGHLVMHRDEETAFIDNDQTLYDWYQSGPQEFEANGFAAEILMPQDSFITKVQGRFSMKIIENASEHFHTSMTATLIRYKELGSFPIGLVFIENKKVKWCQFSEDFVLKFLPINSIVPLNTVAYDIACKGQAIPDKGETVRAVDWFANDFDIDEYKNWKFFEQCFRVSRAGIISCLWGL